MSRRTLADSRAPSAEVGSSRITMRLPNAIARAQATAWRCPPDMSPISSPRAMFTCRRSSSSPVSRAIARSLTQPSASSHPGRTGSRPA
jgi:hypothetical protein